MIGKIKKIGFVFLLTICLCVVLLNAKTNATIGDSGTVVPVSEEKKSILLNGITLHEQDLGFYEDGIKTSNKYKEWSAQYLEMPATDNVNNKIVSWSYRGVDAWNKATVASIAKDFEKHNPGWIVVGGTNNDFFAIDSTGEMDYNAMENGEMIKSRNDVAYDPWRGVIGFTKDNEIIEGAPTITNHHNIHVFTDSTMKNETQTLQASAVNPQYQESNGLLKTSPVSETGITVLTKDVVGKYDLTGYKVVVGKYDITRIGYGNGFVVYVKGEIVEVREGTTYEMPVVTKVLEDRTIRAQEFYLVSKDGSLDSLNVGEYVQIQRDYTGAFEDVYNSVSYYWKILEDGKVLFQGIGEASTRNQLMQEYPDGDFSYITAHKSRCMFGVKEDGTFVMAVIDGSSSTGTTLSEAATYMKEIGCVDAWNFDGGGSATLVARNENGIIQTINAPSDAGGDRSVGNAILMVVRDPGFESQIRYSTPTSVTFNKKQTSDIFNDMENIKITIDGRTIDVPSNQDSVVFDNLLPNTKYDAVITYTYEGVDYSTTMPVQTKEYKSGINFTPTSDGYIVKVSDTDEVLKTISVNIKINDTTYKLENTNELVIDGLLLGSIYDINYSYVVKNIVHGTTYIVNAEVLKLSTLNYQTPILVKFEETSFRNDTLRIRYEYEDTDGLITDIYVLVNGVRDYNLDLSENRGTLTFKDLVTSTNVYTYQLIIEYDTPTSVPITKKISSEILEYGQNGCAHQYDNDCDTTCNLCSEVREVTHQYSNATCTTPKTCSICGATEGSANEHSWEAATCTNPKTCSICGTTEGNANEHSWEAATKKSPKTCSVCGLTEGDKLKGCKKAAAAQIILSISMLTAALIIFRKRK